MKDRYIRQIELIGKEGQKKLKKACVMVIGAGGLGNIAAKYLASTGVGKLILVDYDHVEKSNLNRQVLFNKLSIGKSKVESLKKTLNKINSDVKIKAINKKVNFNSEVYFMEKAIYEKVDVILDCTDNMASAYIIESIALNLQKPLVFAKTSKYSGVVTIIKSPFLKESF